MQKIGVLEHSLKNIYYNKLAYELENEKEKENKIDYNNVEEIIGKIKRNF